MKKYTKIIVSVISIISFFIFLAIFMKWKSADPWIPIPEAFSSAEANKFVIELAGRFQSLSYFQLILGWVIISVGTLLSLLGSILGSTGVEKNNYSVKNLIIGSKGILLVGLGVVALSLGRHFIDRSDSTAKAAAKVNEAIGHLGTKHGNRIAYNVSIKARSMWLEDRLNHIQLDKMLDDNKQKLE